MHSIFLSNLMSYYILYSVMKVVICCKLNIMSTPKFNNLNLNPDLKSHVRIYL